MDASEKTVTLEKANNPTEDWTMVLPRHGKQRRNFPKVKCAEQQQEGKHWVPANLETDPERELKLMNKMQITIEKLEKSDFFRVFLEQIQAPENWERFLKVLGSEQKMQMVLYGIGSIESFEPPRLQLSLALLMKRKLSWIGDVEVFDPVISLTESRVLEALGCFVLSVNEEGRRQALKPILFYMPHCEAELYENLLQTNWSGDMLSRIVLLGNSFDTYRQSWSMFINSRIIRARKHLLASRRFTKELGIETVSDDYFRAFQGSSWHFFSIDANENLQFIEA